MTIEREKYLYEILIRFDRDGYKGSHVIDLERLVDSDSGEAVSEQVGLARPITMVEIGERLPGELAASIEYLDARDAALAARERALSDGQAALAQSQADLTAAMAGNAATAKTLDERAVALEGREAALAQGQDALAAAIAAFEARSAELGGNDLTTEPPADTATA